jgi:hypothetical protein
MAQHFADEVLATRWMPAPIVGKDKERRLAGHHLGHNAYYACDFEDVRCRISHLPARCVFNTAKRPGDGANRSRSACRGRAAPSRTIAAFGC